MFNSSLTLSINNPNFSHKNLHKIFSLTYCSESLTYLRYPSRRPPQIFPIEVQSRSNRVITIAAKFSLIKRFAEYRWAGRVAGARLRPPSQDGFRLTFTMSVWLLRSTILYFVPVWILFRFSHTRLLRKVEEFQLKILLGLFFETKHVDHW